MWASEAYLSRVDMARSSALAQSLYRQGVHRQDRVVAALPPGPEFACLFFAVAELGAVMVPLSPQARDTQLSEVLKDARPVVLVMSRVAERTAIQARENSARSSSPAARPASGPSLDLLMPDSSEAAIALEEPAVEDLLVLLYTSGTSGKPKGTMHSHRSLIGTGIG